MTIPCVHYRIWLIILRFQVVLTSNKFDLIREEKYHEQNLVMFLNYFKIMCLLWWATTKKQGNVYILQPNSTPSIYIPFETMLENLVLKEAVNIVFLKPLSQMRSDLSINHSLRFIAPKEKLSCNLPEMQLLVLSFYELWVHSLRCHEHSDEKCMGGVHQSLYFAVWTCRKLVLTLWSQQTFVYF